MKKMLRYLLLIIILGLSSHSFTYAQEYFRIKADFVVKVKKSDGVLNLTKGKVYYDKNYKDLIYEITFPQKETWNFRDTVLVKFRNDTLFEKAKIPSINEFTVFHLALNSNLSDFGLKNSIYKVNKVEKKNDLVLSYWKIPDQASTILDHVIIAKKDNRLESVVMVGNESKIISKQFFKNYEKIGAFEFPRQIVQILYSEDGKENYQVTEFKNIVINDIENSKMYRFKY